MILEPIRHLALVAAHCDDIAIGAGATVRMLCQANPGMRVTALVLTGAGAVREDEERQPPPGQLGGGEERRHGAPRGG